MVSFPFFGKKQKRTPRGNADINPEILNLIDILTPATGQQFFKRDMHGITTYLSGSEIIGITQAASFKTCVKDRECITPDRLINDGKYIGVNAGTRVDSTIYESVTEALEREKIGYTLWVGMKKPVPMVISTGNGNILIAPVMESP